MQNGFLLDRAKTFISISVIVGPTMIENILSNGKITFPAHANFNVPSNSRRQFYSFEIFSIFFTSFRILVLLVRRLAFICIENVQ